MCVSASRCFNSTRRRAVVAGGCDGYGDHMRTGRLYTTMLVTGLILWAVVMFGLLAFMGGDHGAGHNPHTTTVGGLRK